MIRKNILSICATLFLFACGAKDPILPYYGLSVADPENPGDSIPHTVPEFSFLNQDSVLVTQNEIEGKIHVVNFFFTSCPTICPKMTSQLKRLQKMTEGLDIVILSYSVDPKRDSIGRLREYAVKNGINTSNWHLMTGNGEEIYELGMNGYYLSAMQDDSAPGGFLHSDQVVLVDNKRHIRGFYDGTETEQVNKLVEDIKKLKEHESNE